MADNATGPRFLTIGKTAEILGVSADTIYHLTDSGDIPCVRLGRRKMVPAAVIDRLEERAMASFDVDQVTAALEAHAS